MKIALCTNFLQEEHWRSRLCDAVADKFLTIEDCGGIDAAYLPGCAAAVVALDGPAGLAVVRTLRESSPLPILWIADEPDYALFAYQYRVTEFLLHNATAEQLSAALTHLEEESA